MHTITPSPHRLSCATVIDRGPTGVANGEQTSRNDAAHYLEHNSSVPKIRSSAHTRTRAHTRLRCCDDDNRIAMHEPECSRRATYCASCCTTTRTMDGRDREMRAHTAQVMSLVNLFRSNNSKGHHHVCVRAFVQLNRPNWSRRTPNSRTVLHLRPMYRQMITLEKKFPHTHTHSRILSGRRTQFINRENLTHQCKTNTHFMQLSIFRPVVMVSQLPTPGPSRPESPATNRSQSRQNTF